MDQVQKSNTSANLPIRNILPWIKLASGDVPYFISEDGKDFTPIGQNDAINWPDFNNLFKRKDLDQVENHLKWLKAHGITVLRFMMEYSQNNYRYLERPVGKFRPNMVQLWDDLFHLCEKHEMRLFLTPVDTYWMWLRWKHHPYNKKNGGPCSKRSEWVICESTRDVIKNRFTYFITRWGGSGAIFAWDLWNEIHPAHCGGKSEYITSFISEISDHVRNLELTLYGKSHLQTVSVFEPTLKEHPELADAIFRHPKLDFATSHFYDTATINNPKDTVQSAIVTGKLVREALQHIYDNRPFFDSEHGPIHAFKNRKKILPEDFDDEYFKHIQWAHLASGGAGGGMRWPNRHPHVLTHGMRREQLHLSKFSKLVNWNNFRRKNLNEEIRISSSSFAAFCCADSRQAILYLLRTDSIKKKRVSKDSKSLDVKVIIPEMSAETYLVTEFETSKGIVRNSTETVQISEGKLLLHFKNVTTDLAVLIQSLS